MRISGLIKMTSFFLLLGVTASAQRKDDDAGRLDPYRELISTGRWYLNTPVQLKIHFATRTEPSVNDRENIEADMLLYYGKNDFYMQTGGMEQIVNDSFTVLVNHEARMIRLLSNTTTLTGSMEKMVPSFIADSSLEKLEQMYSIHIGNPEKDTRKMTVESRNKVSGTSYSKEVVTLTYKSVSSQPVSYVSIKRSLVPVDSSVYLRMGNQPLYAGKLVRVKSKMGELFFVMKEKTTECTFIEVSREHHSPPALQQDRIVRATNGEYEPARGFEDYLLSKSF